MSKYVLDGQVYVQRKTGIYRYCNEILKELDKIIKPDEIELIVPKEAVFDDDFQNIKVVRFGRGNGIVWAQTYLPLYCLKHRVVPISFYNTTPILRPGIVVIHDVGYKAWEKGYDSLYGKLSSIWHRFNYWYISKMKYPIITVSNFSKSEICKYYNVSSNRITVISNGWQHYNTITEDNSVFDVFKDINPGNYFFSIGSLENRKNIKWITEVARRNPDSIFVITGESVRNAKVELGVDALANVILTGYLEDSRAKALMSHAKAFVFPSLYEGFGIPPMEALSTGVKVVCAKASSLPEIYEDAVYYIDPYDYDVCLSRLLSDDIIKENADRVLRKYDWKMSAIAFRDFLKNRDHNTIYMKWKDS